MRVFFQKHNKRIWRTLILLLVFLTPISVLTLNLNVTHAFWGDIVEDLGNSISYAILSIGSWLTLAGGRLLELSIEVFVIGFGVLINGGADNVLSGFASSNLGETVSKVWTLVRDICNLLFIFGFLYIGILLIAKNSSSAKGLLAKLIIMALLVNFSLFLTKVVIEFTNVIAYTIYNNMTEGGGKITDSIMDILGLSSIYQFDRNLVELTGGGAVWFFVMAFIFLVITAFVFFAGALMLLTRFVALLFIMMFSPILFAAQIFPATAQHAKTMWKKLFSYSFFAPAYIFLIYVAILVLDGLNIKGDHGYDDLIATAGSEAATASVDSYMVVLNFAVAIIVIQMAASLASKMGLAGGELAIKVADKGKNMVRGVAQGVQSGALYAPRALTRWGVGKTSRGTLKRFDNWQASASAAKDGKGTATSRFVKATNLDRTIRGTLESGTQTTAGLNYSYADNQKYRGEANKRVTANKAAQDRKEKIEQTKAKIANSDPVTADEMKEFVDAIKNLTTDQLKDIDMQILTNEHVAVHLSGKQLDALEKTGKYSDAQIGKIKKARKDGVLGIIKPGGVGSRMVGAQTQREKLALRGADELIKMPIEVFTSSEMAPYLTPTLVEAKMRSGVSAAEMQQIRDNIDYQITIERGLAGGSISTYEKQWKKWVDKSTFASRIGLTKV